MSEAKKHKHVIILGAGSSVTSGYPMANALRLLMSSEKSLREQLVRLGKFNTEHTDKIIAQIMGGENKDTIDLFRHGGFATVDEFSNLAHFRLPTEVQKLKRLLRFALGLHDPEEDFEKSDYYLFIQKLFHNGLFPIRNDVAILTFNYDPYLPYLLSKAHSIRCRVAGQKEDPNAADALTSGFSSRLVGPLECMDDLCVLQLHGSIAWPKRFEGQDVITYADLFGTSIRDRTDKLCFSDCARTVPPVLFPWEVFDDKCNFIDEQGFCLKENPDQRGYREGGYIGETGLHQLFVSIWKRAQKEVTAASKISFIGLSMHEFLNPAFTFLFKEKTSDAGIVFASRDLEGFREQATEVYQNPRSPVFKLRKLLKQIWNRKTGPSFSDGMVQVKTHETFKEFIHYQLD